MSTRRPVRKLNQYYKSNEGFKAWVKANDQWFRENPDVFKQMLRNPSMVNMFTDFMIKNSDRIERRLRRQGRRKK